MTGALGESDGFAVAPHGAPPLAAGDPVDLLLLSAEDSRVRAAHARPALAALLAAAAGRARLRRAGDRSAVGSMPIGMFGLAILLLARRATGSFADRGRVVGAFGIGNALGAVAQGRLMDRLGQTRACCGPPAASCTRSPARRGRRALEGAPAPAWLAAAPRRAASPPPAARRRCARCGARSARDPEQRETAYAMVSIVFEVGVPTAPALAAAIVAPPRRGAPRRAGGGLAAGAAAFSADAARRRAGAAQPHDVGWLGPLAAPGMRTLFVVLGAFGTAVGVVQVLVRRSPAERGSAETGGVCSRRCRRARSGGAVYGARSWPG